MFSTRYFGRAYWGGRYFAPGSDAPPARGLYWSPHFWAGRYWGARYYPGGSAPTPVPVVTSAPIRQAIAAALLADASLAALVGTRIYPLIVPQTSTYPALAWRVTGIDRQHDLDGPTGRAVCDLTVWSVSKRLIDDEAAAEAVRQVLDGLTTASLGGTGVVVLETLSDDEADDWHDPTDGTSRGLIITPIGYRIVYREPKPTRYATP
jgi:hypothetical protein